MEQTLSYWKNLSVRMLLAIRMMFLTTVVWDFFLTVVITTSARSMVLTGIGLQFVPIIIILWVICIIWMMAILLKFIFQNDPAYITRFGYWAFILTLILYIG